MNASNFAVELQDAIDVEVANRNSSRTATEEKYRHDRSGGSGILAAEGDIFLGREGIQYGVTHEGDLHSKRFLAGGSGLMTNPGPSDIRSGPSFKLNAGADLKAIAKTLVDTL